jgi:hypothetical protein
MGAGVSTTGSLNVNGGWVPPGDVDGKREAKNLSGWSSARSSFSVSVACSLEVLFAISQVLFTILFNK